MLYDAIIIGAGPAGLTAAIYAARREMKTIILTKDIGGQVVWATEIENYPGFKNIKSAELIANMSEQVKSLGVEIKLAEVKKIEKENENFKVILENGSLSAKTIISAMGASPRLLGVPGEKEFSGRGVSYCANCDGPFFRGKAVAVIGGGNSALDAAEVLSKIAAKVYSIHRKDKFNAFENLIKEVKSRENITILFNSEIKEIIGDEKVKKIRVLNSQNEGEQEIEISGIFIEIGHIANGNLIKELVETNKRNEIIIDKTGQTKTPGIFAAGDITNLPFKQIVTSAGEGAIAALSAYQYIQMKESGKNEEVSDRSFEKH